MYSTNKIIRTISLIGAVVLAATTARAVDPPPGGGYPNGNTAVGEDSLFSLTTGFGNTGLGFNSLFSLTTGFGNTAIGFQALYSDTTEANYGDNTAIGFQALYSNSGPFSFFNTAIGSRALNHNTIGQYNTATGSFALLSNSVGSYNTANGYSALTSSTGSYNVANGALALNRNTTGNNNTAVGIYALTYNTRGEFNTAIGSDAMLNNHNGSNNIALGYQAGQNLKTGHDNIDIGNPGLRDETSTIRIGRHQTAAYIAGISGATVAEGVGVIVDTNGHLGTVVSSARYKEAIQPMDQASEAILALQPVTFRYKKELDPNGIPQFGLVAEQVEKVDPDLVARDEEGKAYTVRYEAVNAMLLNEFLKEHWKVADQDDEIAELNATVAELKSALKAQAAQIQKVSDQLKTQSAAPRVVGND